jgi:hypothetical protein
MFALACPSCGRTDFLLLSISVVLILYTAMVILQLGRCGKAFAAKRALRLHGDGQS